MRRLTLAVTTTILLAAVAAGMTQAQVPLGRPTPAQGQAPPATDPMASARAPRHLLRNAEDYLKYNEFERALGLLREAEARRNELTAAEQQELVRLIDNARAGLRRVEYSGDGVASGPRRRASAMGQAPVPGALALADPTPVRSIPSTDGVVLTSASNDQAPAAPRSKPAAPVAPAPLSPDQLAIPPLPPEAASAPVETAMVPPSAPELPELPPAAPEALAPPTDLELDPAAAQDVPPIDPAPLAPPPLPVDSDSAPAPVEIPAMDAVPTAELPPVTPETIIPETPALPIPAEVPPLPEEAAPSTPEPRVEAAPTSLPPLPVSENVATSHEFELPPLPSEMANEPSIPAQVDPAASDRFPSTAPLLVRVPSQERETMPTSPPPAPEPLPPLPPPADSVAGDAYPPLPVPADEAAPAPVNLGDSDAPAGLPPASPNDGFRSTLPSELQREVEMIAARQEEERRLREAPAEPGRIMTGAEERDLSTSAVELSRPPSPTESRPIQVIPVPEEYTEIDPRRWEGGRKYWAAAATCHGPLYFQDATLERYGYSSEQYFGRWGRFMTYPLDDPKESELRNQIAQPFVSAGKFALQIALFPYNALMNPPGEAEYDLGYYRPGDQVPKDVIYLPPHGYGPPLRGRKY